MYTTLLGCITGALAASVSANRLLSSRQAQPAIGQLENFQVYEPVLTPNGLKDQYGCIHTAVLMEYNFENSYGKPFVGEYTPPPCDFNRVTMNLTVTSQGRQFDRIAIMYLGDVEVFRTSTAEPTKNGIIWNYVKEMHMYNALWRTPQTIIYDEGNIVDDTYTGPFNTTLTATFFTVPDSPVTADMILPITSKRSSNGMSSVFQIPDQNATVEYTLPQNVNRAVVSLSATGQINEEFWYSNVPTSRTETFINSTGTLLGGGTFREVQLYIDEHLSGVSWPFPVIFTGGIVPGLWRPIAAIDAFDLRQHEIDITPWLGYLLDGQPHSFSIRVASVGEDEKGTAVLASTPSYWLVTGTIFIFQDGIGSVTTGALPDVYMPEIELSSISSITQDEQGQNNSLTYSTQARRILTISSVITTASGSTKAEWTQELTYSNNNRLTSYGLVQWTEQSITGHDFGTGTSASGTDAFTKSYNFPLTVNSSYMQSQDESSLSLQAQLSHGKSMTVLGNPIFPNGLQNINATKSDQTTKIPVQDGHSAQATILPSNSLSSLSYPIFQGSTLQTTQVGFASYFSSPNNSYTFGTTEQHFAVAGLRGNGDDASVELYNRHVKAVNTSIVLDDQIFLGKSIGVPPNGVGVATLNIEGSADEPRRSVRALLGRGSGS